MCTSASDRVVFQNDRSVLLVIEILCDQTLYTIEIDLTRIGVIKRNSLYFTTLDSLTARWNECLKVIKFRTSGEKVRHLAEKRT